MAMFAHNTMPNTKVGTLQYILVNGLAQAKNGVNLMTLAKQLDTMPHITYVYTPDTHAALKIYLSNGTVCVHSTGKILYMGAKTITQLKSLHSEVARMGRSWQGVPIFLSKE